MRQLWLDADLTHALLVPSGDQAKRLRRVLRLRDGDRVRVADGAGAQRLYTLGPDGLRAHGSRTLRALPARRVHLAAGLLKGDRQGWLLQKLVEAGADVIAPLQLTHCVVQLDAKRAAKRAERWRAVVVEAFEQCGRPALPTVAPVSGLAAFLGGLPSGAAVAFADAREAAAETPAVSAGPSVAGERADPACAMALLAWANQRVEADLALVVGPEGGLSDVERALLVRQGATPVHLGANVLRAETAAVVAAWALRASVDGYGAR